MLCLTFSLRRPARLPPARSYPLRPCRNVCPTAGNAGTGLSLVLTAPEGRGALQQGSFIAVSRSPAQAKAPPRIGFGSNAGFRDPWLRSSLSP